ncbi:NAD-dependent succinate-semialdehyde dehydrogenase [Nocardia sp. CA-290969]|uniref:NAD-dependent succinate-semialdehyde dehydrogenase n=1 Tax=Nocardia sp. CA-290969 TaxID=3239986 RepID=UPI003D938388
MPTRDAYPAVKQFVDGRWVDGDAGTFEKVLDPATAETLASYPHVGLGQLDRALAAVSRTARSWRDTPPLRRSDIIRGAARLLRERADPIAFAVSSEQGKPLHEARAEVNISAEIIDWCAEEGRRTYGRIVPSGNDSRLMVTAEPVGPVAAFTPWNFPVLTVARKVAAALAAGCPVIVKAAEETPAGAMAVISAFADAGAPPGVVNLVLGVPAEISEHVLSAGVIRKVSLTGSVGVGRILSRLAAEHDIRTTMELGGNAPVIVEPDIDVDEVALRCATSKFRNAGQVCNSPSRFFVHAAVHDRFVDAVERFVRDIKLGAGTAERTSMGPLANARRVDYVGKALADALDRGAEVVCGGGIPDGAGYFVEPTVLTEVDDCSTVFAEEIFGPVMPIVRYHDLDAAISRANATTYGLASFVFTDSLAKAHRMARDLEAGMVGINTTVVSRAEMPFGGIKASGHGFESGLEGVDAYLRRKAVLEHDPAAPGLGVSH